MTSLVIAQNVALNAAAAQTAIQPSVTPFLPGRNATLVVDVDGLAGATLVVETSPDNTNWTTVATVNAQGPAVIQDVTVAAYMRTHVTVAGTAGKGSAYLIGGA